MGNYDITKPEFQVHLKGPYLLINNFGDKRLLLYKLKFEPYTKKAVNVPGKP